MRRAAPTSDAGRPHGSGQYSEEAARRPPMTTARRGSSRDAERVASISHAPKRMLQGEARARDRLAAAASQDEAEESDATEEEAT